MGDQAVALPVARGVCGPRANLRQQSAVALVRCLAVAAVVEVNAVVHVGVLRRGAVGHDAVQVDGEDGRFVSELRDHVVEDRVQLVHLPVVRRDRVGLVADPDERRRLRLRPP